METKSERVVNRVRELAASGRPLLIIGPRGSGKVFYVTEALRLPEQAQTPHVVSMDCFDGHEPMSEYIASRPLGPIVLEGVDRTPSGAVLGLASFLKNTTRVVVATCEDPLQVPSMLLEKLSVISIGDLRPSFE